MSENFAGGVEVSPSDLRFRFQLNKQLLATITVNNPNGQRVAFKIKTTAPKKYVVRPSSGVVEPRSNQSVQVIMQVCRARGRALGAFAVGPSDKSRANVPGALWGRPQHKRHVCRSAFRARLQVHA